MEVSWHSFGHSVGWAGAVVRVVLAAVWMLQEQVTLSGSVQEPGINTDCACHLKGPVKHHGTSAK